MLKKKVEKKRRPLSCFFCQEKTLPDYKNPQILRRFMTERGKILSASKTGVCAKHQRKLAEQIKRARHLSLLPFVSRL